MMQIQQLNLCQAGTLSIVNVTIEASLGRCFNDVLKQSCYETKLQQISEFNGCVDINWDIDHEPDFTMKSD